MLAYTGKNTLVVGGKVDYVEGLRLDASELLEIDYVGSFTPIYHMHLHSLSCIS